MYAKHSIYYDKLPDLFLAYDIWSVEDKEFLSPEVVSDLLDKTNIKYIKSDKVIIKSIDDIIKLSESVSEYRDGLVEGIVIKTSSGRFIDKCFKIVNKHFNRSDNFNEILLKNRITR
jgi:hypothetical protein